MLVLLMFISPIVAQEYDDFQNTSTGLDQILEIIKNDEGLQANVPQEEILEAVYYANVMNQIIIDSIIQTNIAADRDLSLQDIRNLNSYVNSHYSSIWLVAHGDDENGVETGYHLVQNDGATTQLYGENAVNTVFDGIYHLGFPQANNDQIQNEDGNANAQYSDITLWLNNLLANDLVNTTNLVGNLQQDSVLVVVPQEITSSQITFHLLVNESVFEQRELSITPKFLCGSSVIRLAKTSTLTTSVVSSKDKLTLAQLSFNLNDFSARIPTDNSCELVLFLEDEYLTQINLEVPLNFNFEEQSTHITSISGRSSDIANYMGLALRDDFTTGMNSIRFTVVNNEAFEKEYSIELSSRELGVSLNQNIYLKAYGKKDVFIPISIKDSYDSGTYSVKFNVYDGEDRVSRYSYITLQ